MRQKEPTTFSNFLLSSFVIWAARWLCAVAIALVVWKSLIPSFSQNAVPHMDKLLHFGAYLIIGGLALLSRFSRKGMLTLIIVIALGVLVEILQGTMSVGRSASIADALANSLGAVLAYAIWYSLSGRFGEPKTETLSHAG
jgi:VanZ family protein